LKVAVSNAALADIARLQFFLVRENPNAAKRAAGALDRAIRSLEFLPDRGRPSPLTGARELIVPFGKSAYVIRYAHLAGTDEILILRIWHGREARG
jgi:plasmid stabilization system protein ParE